jgi:CRP-like cAMP-binding protein
MPVLVGAGVAVAVGALVGRVLVGAVATRAPSPYETTLARVATLPIFAGVSTAQLEAALRNVRPHPMALGDVVIRQGDPADRFYIIDTGRVRVTQRGDAPQERVVRDMGPDSVFGEIGLLRGSPRTATVTAVEPGLLLALDRDDFLALVAAEGRLGSRLLDLHRGSPTGESRADAIGVSAS